jgi:hypothetical protein
MKILDYFSNLSLMMIIMFGILLVVIGIIAYRGSESAVSRTFSLIGAIVGVISILFGVYGFTLSLNNSTVVPLPQDSISSVLSEPSSISRFPTQTPRQSIFYTPENTPRSESTSSSSASLDEQLPSLNQSNMFD